MWPGPRPSLVRPLATLRAMFSRWEILMLVCATQSTSQSRSPVSVSSLVNKAGNKPTYAKVEVSQSQTEKAPMRPLLRLESTN